MTKPTERQLAFIEDIEDVTGRRFTGETKKNASDFIDTNIVLYKALIAAEMESEHGDYGDRDD